MRLSYVVPLALLGAVQAAVSTISAYGNKFFYENGTRNVPFHLAAAGLTD